MANLSATATPSAESARTTSYDSMDDVIDAFGNLVFVIALNITRDRAVAAEITQDVWLAIWERGLGELNAKDRPIAWVQTVARNAALDHVRRAKVEQRRIAASRSESTSSPNNDPSETVTTSQMMRSVIRELPPGMRQVVVMRYYRNLTDVDIARRLGISKRTVRSQLCRARRKLRAAVESLDGS